MDGDEPRGLIDGAVTVRRVHGNDGADQYWEAVPPVIGSDGGSTWIGSGNRFQPAEFPLSNAESFFLGIDTQPDVLTEQAVLGTSNAAGEFLVILNRRKHGSITIQIRDTAGKELVEHADGSLALGRRILVTGTLNKTKSRYMKSNPGPRLRRRNLTWWSSDQKARYTSRHQVLGFPSEVLHQSIISTQATL